MDSNTRPSNGYYAPLALLSQHNNPSTEAECLAMIKHACNQLETLRVQAWHQHRPAPGPGPGPGPGMPQTFLGNPYSHRVSLAGRIPTYGVPKKNQRPCHVCRARRKKCSLVSLFPYLCTRCSNMGLHACPPPSHFIDVAIHKPQTVKNEPKDGDFMDKHLLGAEAEAGLQLRSEPGAPGRTSGLDLLQG